MGRQVCYRMITITTKLCYLGSCSNPWTYFYNKKLKLDKFFISKPSQNYGVSLKYGVTVTPQFYLHPDKAPHLDPNQ